MTHTSLCRRSCTTGGGIVSMYNRWRDCVHVQRVEGLCPAFMTHTSLCRRSCTTGGGIVSSFYVARLVSASVTAPLYCAICLVDIVTTERVLCLLMMTDREIESYTIHTSLCRRSCIDP
eukprot:TRINITY_DN11242_c0_g1_i5.p2 TRINITY_DN11242_c0_g1~~TRINITY_DN11242_c0_g1_i5.p2  ORF type:complete len:119 (+),score=9.42 TRINITY_DN11242_c0_g1_i5:118-474(+)